MEPEWSEEDEEQARKLAQKIVDRGMALPAILFLESVRPLHFIGGQFMHFMAPISGVVVGKWDLDRVGNFLEHRGAVPFVIEEIQRREKERSEQEKARKHNARQQRRRQSDKPLPPPAGRPEDKKDSRRP